MMQLLINQWNEFDRLYCILHRKNFGDKKKLQKFNFYNAYNGAKKQKHRFVESVKKCVKLNSVKRLNLMVPGFLTVHVVLTIVT